MKWLKVEGLRFKVAGLCLVVMLYSCLNSFSQKVSATIDREKMLIGEQLELQLKVGDIDRKKTDILKWFSLPDTFNHMEVVTRFPIDTIKLGESFTYIQKIKLTSFDSGYWAFPDMSIVLNNQQSIAALPISVAVLPVDVSNMVDYHDIKDIGGLLWVLLFWH